jgi:uncharacterized membrane protein
MDLALVALLAATLSMGLVTGAFLLFAHDIMPGLRATDDRTFVAAFQAIDRAIINPWFMVTSFFGALFLTGAALLLHLGEDAFGWILAAFVLYVVTVVITVAVHVPRNDAIKAAGDPGHIDVTAVRAVFDEAFWMRWNLVRVVLSSTAFGLLAWALVVAGGSRA